MNHKRFIYIIVALTISVVILGLLVLLYVTSTQRTTNQTIDSFDSCVAAGHEVMKSDPEQCRTPDGRIFANTAYIPGQAVNFTGTIVCLEPEGDGPHTLECTAGLRTNDGSDYALIAQQDDYELTAAAGSDRNIEISGMLEPDNNGYYKTSGTIRVTSYSFL